MSRKNSLSKIKYFPAELKFEIAQHLPFTDLIYIDDKLANKKYNPFEYSWEDAVIHNNLDALKWLHKHHKPGAKEYALSHAVLRRNKNLVKWMMKNLDVKCTQSLLDIATINGYNDIVKILMSKPGNCDFITAYASREDMFNSPVKSSSKRHRSATRYQSSLMSRSDIIRRKTA